MSRFREFEEVYTTKTVQEHLLKVMDAALNLGLYPEAEPYWERSDHGYPIMRYRVSVYKLGNLRNEEGE